MEGILINHLRDLLTEPQGDRKEAKQRISQHIPLKVTQEQNLALMRVATLEEVEEIVKGMKKNKAPGPDRFTAEFFQATWPFMEKDILDVVEESRRNQKVCPRLNSTFITLIPKTSKSEDPQGFRPIALCNVIYKIISKTIANHLKLLLPTIINLEKTCYVEGRKILDSIILT